MKKRFTLLLLLWACFQASAQEQLSNAGATGFSSATHLFMASLNNKCLFTETFSNGLENALLATDGTTQGTVLLSKNLIVAQNKKQFFVNGNKMFYLVRNDDMKAVEVWRTDGTPANTVKINAVADSSFFASSDYFLQKSDNYYFLVAYASATKKAFIGQFNQEFTLLTQESSTGKYEGYPLLFKDLLFIGKSLYRTKDNTANKDLNTDFYPDAEEFTVAGDKLYFMAYRQNMLFEYDGINTRQITLPTGYSYSAFARRIFNANNRLYMVHVVSDGFTPDDMVTRVKEFVYNPNTYSFEQVFSVTPWGHVTKAQLLDQRSYLVNYYAGTNARNLSINKIAYNSTLQTTTKKFADNQLYSIVLSNGKNLFILKKDYSDSDHILYNADTEKVLALPAEMVFNEFIGEIKPGVWLLNGKWGDREEGLYRMDEDNGGLYFLRKNSAAGKGIQKLYKLNDKTLIWSVPEKDGTIVYKSDGTKNGTIALNTINTYSEFPHITEYDYSNLSDGSLLVTNLREAEYDRSCSYCTRTLKPLVFATDGTSEGTKKIFESGMPLLYYANSKAGDDIYHAVIGNENIYSMSIHKNSLKNTALSPIGPGLSVIPNEYIGFFGASIIYSRSVGSITYKYLGKGEVITRPDFSPNFIGSVNKKALFQASTDTQISIYALKDNEMVRLFTMQSYSPARAYDMLFDNGIYRVFAGDADEIYVTDGTPDNTIKIPVLFKDYKLTRAKEIDDTYYFLFSRTVNNINEYKVQTYKNGQVAESGISTVVFDMTPVKIGGSMYFYRYGFSNGVGIEIFRLENANLTKVTFIGSDYEFFPVRVLSTGILANPFGKVHLWTPGGSYEVAKGWLGEAVQLNNKYIFAINEINRQLVYATDENGTKAQLLKEFQAPNIYFRVLENKVYFSGGTPEAGVEPWVTDGTPEGTRMVGDLWKGPQSSNPDIFAMTSVNGIPVCLASTPDLGRQLFSLQLKLAQPLLVVPNTRACMGDTIVLTAPKGFDSYQWFINDTQELITTDNKLSITKPGTYKVIVSKAKAMSVPSNAVSIYFVPLPAKPIIKQETNQLSVTTTGQLQWYLNGTAITDATSNTLIYNGIGEYTVKITDNGCSTLSDKMIVSITSLEKELVFNVYPNPASHQLVVNGNQNKPTNLVMTDLNGRIVLQKTLRAGVNEINIKDFTKGVYILKLDTITRKIIIE